ncbi:hypothetical protein XAP7430_130001 [Xanthomonas phaseoli pv. phaseoli]|uniref:Transposase n=1 Tax=Xanthomonas campestris pv. phaseoli TaxID=317013 RepID=A0AB38DVZ4_XANCH|nr:hypothetical protein XAP7430_130001 [Xanthomonas phaseoli pv. phaseoli]
MHACATQWMRRWLLKTSDCFYRRISWKNEKYQVWTNWKNVQKRLKMIVLQGLWTATG